MGSTRRDVHIDRPLTNVAIAYRPEGFIADMIAPVVPVPHRSDGYYVWNSAEAYRRDNAYRAPGTEARRITRSVASDTFYCHNYALKDQIPFEDIRDADEGFVFTERQVRAESIKDKLYMDKEYRVATKLTDSTYVGSYSATASAWNVPGGSGRPILDVKTAIEDVENRTGQKVNSVVFGLNAWRSFKYHESVQNYLYGSAGAGGDGRTVALDQVKKIFDLERALVGGAYINSAQEGQAQSLASLWADYVLLYFAPTGPRKDKPSYMYSFLWQAMGMPMQAEVRERPVIRAEEVELGEYCDEKVTASALSFLITHVNCSQ